MAENWNHIDERIWKLHQRGVTNFETIAKKIGRPGDVERVKVGLLRKGIALYKRLERIGYYD